MPSTLLIYLSLYFFFTINGDAPPHCPLLSLGPHFSSPHGGLRAGFPGDQTIAEQLISNSKSIADIYYENEIKTL